MVCPSLVEPSLAVVRAALLALAAWLAIALPAAAQSRTILDGTRQTQGSLFEQAEPASQWVGAPKPGDETIPSPQVEAAAPNLMACPRQPGLLQRLLGPEQGQGLHTTVQRESWLRRPASVTWFLGGVVGSPLINDWVRADGGIFGGLAVGWDFDHYWGTEFRLAFATLSLVDSQRAVDAETWYNQQNGVASLDPMANGGPNATRNADLMIYTLSALYYPWGDTPFRPYVSVGIGGTRLSFSDRLANIHDPTLMTMPLAIGFKYHWTDWLALRFEMCDNFAFGLEGVQTLHNVSIIGAAEIRLGGSHRSYWPWVPSRNAF